MPIISPEAIFHGDAQQRYEQLVASIDGIVWEADVRTLEATFVSGQAEPLLGYPTCHWLTPGFWVDHLHPDDRERALEDCQLAIREKRRYSLEYRMIAADGRVVWLRDTVSPVVEGGEVTGLRGVAIDITDRKQTEEALREREVLYQNLQDSEARFRTFVDHATDAFFLHDDQGIILDVNQQACESLGYSREELIGITAHAFDPDIELSFNQRLWERLLAGEEVVFDTRHHRKDGTMFPVEVRIRPFIQGGRRFSVSLARDISERKRAEDELRASEARFRMLVDQATDAFFLGDEQGRVLDVNQQACASLGYTREELIGMTPLVYDVNASPAFLDPIRARLATGEVVAFDSRHRRKDGTAFPVEVRARWFWQGGRRFGLALARDITERKRAEQALVESYNLLNAVVEGISDSVFVKDLQGRYLMINSAGARFFDKRVEEIIGKDDRALLAPEIAGAIMARDRQLMAAGASQTFEEIATSAGVTRTYLSTESAYRDVQGDVIGLIGIRRDITELKRLEEQFRQAQKMEAVGRLAGGVAHDFNNLLTVIIGNSELVYESLRAHDPNLELVAQIRQSSERAATLTRQLLAFSRKQILQPEVVNLNMLLSELLKLLQRLLGDDIELALVPGGGLGRTKIDPGQFEQAIINLAVNARDAMPEGGRLTIETDNIDLNERYAEYHPEVKPGRYIQVVVSDSGEGMDEATRARIFEPFFTTKEPGKGTGLGLAMVYGFVKQSGGHIEAYSELGHGTTFKVYLPRTDEDLSSARAPADLLDVRRGTETILVVEDEAALRDQIRLILQSYGYTVLTARDGQDGLHIARQYPAVIHLVMTDLVMPRMSGRQLADLLGQARPGVRVLFMSGYTDEAMLRHGVLEAGVAFLQKPFTPMHLAHKVGEVLDAKENLD